jgi:hypothetical protein
MSYQGDGHRPRQRAGHPPCDHSLLALRVLDLLGPLRRLQA